MAWLAEPEAEPAGTGTRWGQRRIGDAAGGANRRLTHGDGPSREQGWDCALHPLNPRDVPYGDPAPEVGHTET